MKWIRNDKAVAIDQFLNIYLRVLLTDACLSGVTKVLWMLLILCLLLVINSSLGTPRLSNEGSPEMFLKGSGCVVISLKS